MYHFTSTKYVSPAYRIQDMYHFITHSQLVCKTAKTSPVFCSHYLSFSICKVRLRWRQSRHFPAPVVVLTFLLSDLCDIGWLKTAFSFPNDAIFIPFHCYFREQSDGALLSSMVCLSKKVDMPYWCNPFSVTLANKTTNNIVEGRPILWYQLQERLFSFIAGQIYAFPGDPPWV